MSTPWLAPCCIEGAKHVKKTLRLEMEHSGKVVSEHDDLLLVLGVKMGSLNLESNESVL